MKWRPIITVGLVCPTNRAWITHRTTPAAAAHTSPTVMMGRHFIITHHLRADPLAEQVPAQVLAGGRPDRQTDTGARAPVPTIRPPSAARTLAARSALGAAGAAGRPA